MVYEFLELQRETYFTWAVFYKNLQMFQSAQVRNSIVALYIRSFLALMNVSKCLWNTPRVLTFKQYNEIVTKFSVGNFSSPKSKIKTNAPKHTEDHGAFKQSNKSSHELQVASLGSTIRESWFSCLTPRHSKRHKLN